MKSYNLIYFIFLSVLLSCVLQQPNVRSPIQAGSTTETEEEPPEELELEATDSGRGGALPYDLIPDTLISLTCPEVGQPGNTIKADTLTMGVYHKYGLKLHPSFIRENNIYANTPAPVIRELLESSPKRDAKAFLGVRYESFPENTLSLGSGDVEEFFPPLNRSNSLDLLSQGQNVLYSRVDSRNPRQRVQHSEIWRASPVLSGIDLINYAYDFEPGNNRDYLLTISYVLGVQAPYQRIYSHSDHLYGRSYKLIFNDSFKADYLKDVREEHLETTKPAGKWFCPEDLRFTVHRATQQWGSLFNQYKNSPPENLDPRLKAALDETEYEGWCDIEKTYYRDLTERQKFFLEQEFGERWYNEVEVGKTVYFRRGELVDSRQNCIRFKQGTCSIRDNASSYRIEYNPSLIRNCIRISKITNVAPQNSTSDEPFINKEYYKICPSWLSICLRR